MSKGTVLLLVLFSLIASGITVTKPVLSTIVADEDPWMPKTPLQEARLGLGVVAVNEKIYAIGGYAGSGGYLDTNEEYDPKLDAWTFKTPIPTPMAYFGITVYLDKVYCISGETGANHLYDPATDTWETRAPLPNPRIGIRANTVNGKIYIIGGESNITDVYDPATDSWTTKAPMPLNLRLVMGWTCTSVVADGKVHVIGASPFSNSHQIYDPASDNWSLGEPLIAGYYFASAGASTGVNASKRIYVFGADRSLWTLNAPTLTSQSYDPKTNAWTECAPVPSGHLNAGIAVIDDKFYVIGGGGAGLANAVYANALNSLYTPIGYGTPDPSYVPSTDSAAPEIVVLSPENKTYYTIDIPLNFTINEPDSWMRYKLDAQTVAEISENTTLTGLSYGSHNLILYATDSAGNTGASETIIFSIAKEAEPFLTAFVTVIAAVSVTIVCIGLVVYFVKFKKKVT